MRGEKSHNQKKTSNSNSSVDERLVKKRKPKGERKERSKNYDNDEKLRLISVMKPHVKIIDCKKTDSNNSTKKKAAWGKVTAGFNATSAYKRSTEELKTLWENLKRIARKGGKGDKIGVKQTGGGPPPKQQLTPISNLVVATNPPLFIPPKNRFDSDASFVSSKGKNKNMYLKTSIYSSNEFKMNISMYYFYCSAFIQEIQNTLYRY